MNFDAELITNLLTCEKEIIHAPGKVKLERGHYRIEFELQSVDKEFYFKGFGRYNSVFNENFLIGLVYNPKHEKGVYEILRCNGPQGEHKMFPHHVHFHIHKISTEAIEKDLREDCYVEITDKYQNFEDALKFFVKYIHVKVEDIKRYFPGQDLQTELFNFEK
ncbi:MAG TPA: hypothetical protein ENN22_05375 [bacterium]|nr:hypothetical protein [bacterium]